MSLSACETLLEIRAIEQLKYRYMRAVDSHDWDLMRQCLAEDVRVWLANGTYQYQGREKAIGWMSAVMNDTFFSSHIVMHPEIEFTSPTEANGKWRLQDIDYFTKANPEVKEGDIRGGEKLEGAAYYHDEYRKMDGRWWIQSTGYVQIYEAIWRPDFSGEGEHLKVEPLRGMKPS